jgi:hypothetical protein
LYADEKFQVLTWSLRNEIPDGLLKISVGCLGRRIYQNRFFSRLTAEKTFFSWAII